MFLCSLRYCLKCYFSKGVYSFTLSTVYIYMYIHIHTCIYTHTHTHTHTYTCWFLWFTGTLHRRNGFYTVQTVCAIALHLNLALTGDSAFLLSPRKTHSVWFISILNYGDTENILINHLLLVIPVSYPCHYTNLCPHKPHKHACTHTYKHAHTLHQTVFISITNNDEVFSIFNSLLAGCWMFVGC